MNNKHVRKEIVFEGKNLVLETGLLAVQANMAVKASYGDSVVLATVVSGGLNPDIEYFPLSVNYEEKLYASGSIKTSRFVKRDGRPTDDAVITRRLVDHAIRPLFPNDFMDEVQVVVTVLSLDPASDPEFLSMTAVSAALQASDIPWNGPTVSLRVGYDGNVYVANPPLEHLKTSSLDMIVSFVGKDKKFLALEAEAHILPEEKILGAIEFARDKVDRVLDLIFEFSKEVNPEGSKYTYLSRAIDPGLMKDISSVAKERVVKTMTKGFDKLKLKEEQEALLQEIFTKFEGKYKKADMARAFEELEKHALQHLILVEHKRPDGREVKEIRDISTSVGILPRTHGSAIFTRGVTQVLTVVTLGSPSLELLIQDMYGEATKRFMHFYNFPPFSVGETGRVGAPGGREIGHGMLAEKALKPVIPTQKDFPYTIVLVSETLSSSGSSSMASACASTLALMDAGVPIKDMVAGVGVGLIVDDEMSQQLIMTDLAYMEDAFGFLDFKMAGTRKGVTAIQVDMKLSGIPMSLLPKIFEQSKEGRLTVLDEMEKTIGKPRDSVSRYAPKTALVKIDPAKIGAVIGSGGKTIKEIEEKTGATLSIEPDGTVIISSSSIEGIEKAKGMVEGITKEIEQGEVYDGVVKEVVDFGAFVEILPGKQGLLHVSELAYDYVKSVEDIVKVGDIVKVKVIEVSRDGKVSLSRKALMTPPDGYEPRPDKPRPFDRKRERHGRFGRRS